MPRDYDTNVTKPLAHRVQLRLGLSTDGGDIIRFVVQLEYRLQGEWTTVVRSDHDPDSAFGHDVREEGTHLDVYRDGEKYRVETLSGPVPPDEALTIAEEDLRENVEHYIKRFETWHGVTERSDL